MLNQIYTGHPKHDSNTNRVWEQYNLEYDKSEYQEKSRDNFVKWQAKDKDLIIVS